MAKPKSSNKSFIGKKNNFTARNVKSKMSKSAKQKLKNVLVNQGIPKPELIKEVNGNKLKILTNHQKEGRANISLTKCNENSPPSKRNKVKQQNSQRIPKPTEIKKISNNKLKNVPNHKRQENNAKIYSTSSTDKPPPSKLNNVKQQNNQGIPKPPEIKKNPNNKLNNLPNLEKLASTKLNSGKHKNTNKPNQPQNKMLNKNEKLKTVNTNGNKVKTQKKSEKTLQPKPAEKKNKKIGEEIMISNVNSKSLKKPKLAKFQNKLSEPVVKKPKKFNLANQFKVTDCTPVKESKVYSSKTNGHPLPPSVKQEFNGNVKTESYKKLKLRTENIRSSTKEFDAGSNSDEDSYIDKFFSDNEDDVNEEVNSAKEESDYDTDDDSIDHANDDDDLENEEMDMHTDADETFDNDEVSEDDGKLLEHLKEIVSGNSDFDDDEDSMSSEEFMSNEESMSNKESISNEDLNSNEESSNEDSMSNEETMSFEGYWPAFDQDNYGDGSISQEDSVCEYSAEEIFSDAENPVVFSSSDEDSNNDETTGMEIVNYNSEENNSNSDNGESSDFYDDSYDDDTGSFDDNDNWSSLESSNSSEDEVTVSDDYEFNSFDDEMEETTEDSDTDNTYNEFLSGDYQDDPNDTDYSNDNLLYISRGQAKVYDLSDNNISFNSDDDGQIIEIPSKPISGYTSEDSCPQLVPITKTNSDIKLNSTKKKSAKITISDYASDDSCPQLVPITEPISNTRNDDKINSTPTKKRLNTTNNNVHTPLTDPCTPINVSSPIAHVWRKCPIPIFDNSVNNQNVSIESMIMKMSSKNIVTQDQEAEQEDETMETEFKLESNLPEDISNEENVRNDEQIEMDDNDDEFVEQPFESGQPVKYKFQCPQEQFNETMDYDEDVDPVLQPKFFNSLNSRQVLLVLKSSLHFHGILSIKLLAGNAQVYGYELKLNKAITAYSPRGHSFINITPIKHNRTETNIDNVEHLLDDLKPGFLHTDIYNAINVFDPANDALVLLERDTTSKSINMIDKYMKQTVFPNINAFNSRRTFYSTEFILHCQFYLKPKTRLTTSSQWHSVNMNTNSKLMVIGGKGVGKSTLVRHLVNTNLDKYKKMLLIDLDIGQPELFVPQTVSATCLSEPILGPGYLLNKQPDKAYLFGDINVVVSPIKYLKCVLRLLRVCQETAEYQNIPWIINTMGYNRGFGLELTAVIIKALQMTDLIQIRSNREIDNFDRILTSDEVNEFKFNIFQDEVNDIAANESSSIACNYQTHVWESMARKFGERKNEWDMSAKDLRFAIILANLGKLLKGAAEWITDVKPCCASLDNLKVIVATEDVVNKNLHSSLINANLVYLCRTSDDDDNNVVECLGIGIVRAVDQLEKKVYLLPDISLNELSKVNALAICSIPLPTSILLNHNNRVNGIVPYVYNTDDFVGSKQIVQISYRPDRFMQNNHVKLFD